MTAAKRAPWIAALFVVGGIVAWRWAVRASTPDLDATPTPVLPATATVPAPPVIATSAEAIRETAARSGADAAAVSPLVGAHSFHLRCIEPEGWALPGARCVQFRDSAVLASGVTDAGGLVLLQAVEAEVIVLAPGWEPVRRSIRPDAEYVDFALRDEATLGGRVLVDGRAPEEPIELRFDASKPPAGLLGLAPAVEQALADSTMLHGLHWTSSEPSGEFRFRGLPRDASGDLAWDEPLFVEPGVAGAGTRTLAVEAPRTDVVLRLTRGLELALRVVDSGGVAAPAARVEVDLGPEIAAPLAVVRAITDQEGRARCSFGASRPSRVVVRIRAEDGGGAAEFELRPPGTGGVWDVGDLALSISQHVTVRVLDDAGAPIADAAVTPLPSRATPTERSNAAGELVLAPASSDVGLLVQAVGYTSAEHALARGVERVEVVLARACLLEFSLRDAEGFDARRLQVRVLGEAPAFVDQLPGGLPSLQEFGARLGRPDPDGRRAFLVGFSTSTPRVSGLIPGRAYDVELVGDHGPPLAQVRVAPLAPGEHRRVELRPTRRPQSLRITVLAPDRSPVAGAQVGFLHGSGGMRARTDSEGIAMIDSIVADTIALRIQAPGFPERLLHGLAVPPNEVTIELDLPRTLEVELVGRDGTPFQENATVRAGPDVLSMQPGRPLGEGRYEVRMLPGGEVVVWVGNGSFPAVRRVHDTAVPRLRIVVGEVGCIAVRLSDDSRPPDGGLWLAVRRAGEDAVLVRTQLIRDGAEAFRAQETGLALGEYVIGVERREVLPPCEWLRVGPTRTVVLDARRESVEVELAP